MRQPNRKYQDLYWFLLKEEINGHSDIVVKQYDTQEVKIISMFMHSQISQIKQKNVTGICNAQTYGLEKEFWNMAIKVNKLWIKNFCNFTIERFSDQ